MCLDGNRQIRVLGGECSRSCVCPLRVDYCIVSPRRWCVSCIHAVRSVTDAHLLGFHARGLVFPIVPRFTRIIIHYSSLAAPCDSSPLNWFSPAVRITVLTVPIKFRALQQQFLILSCRLFRHFLIDDFHFIQNFDFKYCYNFQI